MKNRTKIVAAALAVASLAAVSIVSAHPGYGYGMGPGAGMMGHGHGMGPGYGMGRMHGFDSPAVTKARLADLKAELKITPAQESAWAAYETQVQQQATTRQAFHAAMLAQMQDPKATIDHSAQHEAMSKLMAAQAEARSTLYAALTTDQKALFDQVRGPGFGRHMGW